MRSCRRPPHAPRRTDARRVCRNVSNTGSGSHKVLYDLVNSRTSSAHFSTTRRKKSIFGQGSGGGAPSSKVKSQISNKCEMTNPNKTEELCEVSFRLQLTCSLQDRYYLLVEIIHILCEIAGRYCCTLPGNRAPPAV